MEELRKFLFGEIRCDGCGCTIDSHCNDEFLRDIEDLTECALPALGWEEQPDDKWLCPDCAQHPGHRIASGQGYVRTKNTTLSGLRCDHCGNDFVDSEGFSCWVDFSYTQELANDYGWIDIEDGKMICPDCYKTCPAMADEYEENYEEVYCSKCPHKDDCNEVVIREKPLPSDACLVAIMSEKGRLEPCPYLSRGRLHEEVCGLPDGEKCPRVTWWEKEKVEVEKNNEEIRKWAEEDNAHK